MIKAIWLAADTTRRQALKAALKLWLPHYEKRNDESKEGEAESARNQRVEH